MPKMCVGGAMTRLGVLIVSLAFLAVSAGARAEQSADWAVVCDDDDPAAASHCYLSLLAGSIGQGNWLGIAVQRLNGSHEVQVTGNGVDFGRAEINLQGETIQSDTIIVTDYCYDSYCVFVQADELVEQFRKGAAADISLYDGGGAAAVKEQVSLIGFTRAHRTYLERIGE